jgi:teichuronic acid biosynthesis glycosyltransferase TuaC
MTDVLWIVPGYPWSEQPAGGIFHRTQARALARQGLSIIVAAPVPYAPWPLRSLRPRWGAYSRAPLDADDAGVRVIRPRYLNVPRQPRWAQADRLIAQSMWRSRDRWSGASLIHGHSAVEGMAAWRLGRLAGLPFVLTFHGSDINTWPAAHPDRIDDLRAAVREAAAVIAVSGALAQRVKELTGVDALALPLGSDHRALQAMRVDRDIVRRALDIPGDRVVALFVGHLLRAKGVRTFVDAVDRVGDPLLGILVGGGPEEGYGQQGGIHGGRLRYTGELPHEEALRYLSAADVLVLPSHGEGLPTVVVEAGSLGIPVIATAVGGIPELLGSERGTLMAGLGPDALADALRGFLAKREGAAAAAARLQAHVLAHYDVEANAGQLLDCYRAARGTVRRP